MVVCNNCRRPNVTVESTTVLIGSTKTTSMEDVSAGVHEKKKEYLRSKDKAKNDMMYQDIYNCICQNTKK